MVLKSKQHNNISICLSIALIEYLNPIWNWHNFNNFLLFVCVQCLKRYIKIILCVKIIHDSVGKWLMYGFIYAVYIFLFHFSFSAHHKLYRHNMMMLRINLRNCTEYKFLLLVVYYGHLALLCRNIIRHLQEL